MNGWISGRERSGTKIVKLRDKRVYNFVSFCPSNGVILYRVDLYRKEGCTRSISSLLTRMYTLYS